MKAPKTFEMEMQAAELGNLAWVRLQELMDGNLSDRDRIDPESVEEAEKMLKFKRAISERADFLLIRLRYESPDPALTSAEQPK